MVFACLVLTVFSTIDQYEEVASRVLLKMVSRLFSNGFCLLMENQFMIGNRHGSLVRHRIHASDVVGWMSFSVSRMDGSASIFTQSILCYRFVINCHHKFEC